MATDAIVVLEQLRCTILRNTPGGATGGLEPYIWPALVRVDDNTLATPDLVAIGTPALGNARIVLKDDMRAGQTASIPSSVGVLRVRLDDSLVTRRLVLVVALLEMDETPRDAMNAGFQAYSTELRAAVADNLLALSGEDEEAERLAIEEIKTRVADRVESATEDGLTAFEKAKVVAGILNLDDAIASDFISFGEDNVLVPTTFTLVFELVFEAPSGPEVFGRWEIDGQLQVQPVVIDRCQSQVDAVNAAQSAVNDIEAQISDLQAQLRGEGEESPLPKSFINSEIERLREEELGPAIAALSDVRAALESCRLGRGITHGPLEGGVATL